MNDRNAIATALALAAALLLTTTALAEDPSRFAGSGPNWQADGTYLLRTNDLGSIQTYYRDVGVGQLFLAGQAEREEMRETCLSLGKDWRPLGHVKLPDRAGKRAYPLYLCYYVAPNPDHVARAKCANLGLVLLENRSQRREIVCGRAASGPVARLES